MRGRVGAVGVGLCLLLAGCVPGEQMPFLVSNPFAQSPVPQPMTSMYPPSKLKEQAERVLFLGDKIVKANPEIGLRPQFLTIGSEQPEIFHRGQQEIFLTEGLISKCGSDGQLAAVLCSELGKMAAERETLLLPETRQPERTPPVDVPVGNDSGGVFGPPDGTHRVELVRLERERQKQNETMPPTPEALSRRFLQKAGYPLDELDAARPLLRLSDSNGSWRRQMLGGNF